MLRRDLVDLKNMRSHDTPVTSGVRIPEIVAQILGVELGKIAPSVSSTTCT